MATPKATQRRSEPPVEIVILLSGGIDSAALVAFYRSMRAPMACLFVDYGQPAASHEQQAAAAVAQHFGVPLRRVRFATDSAFGPGEIRSRNAFLAAVAALGAPDSVWGIALGVHAGTNYPDCSREFIEAMTSVLARQSRPIQLLAPFLDWPRCDVIGYCLREGVPIALTYSCEAGTRPPCGVCLSCRDREGL